MPPDHSPQLRAAPTANCLAHVLSADFLRLFIRMKPCGLRPLSPAPRQKTSLSSRFQRGQPALITEPTAVPAGAGFSFGRPNLL